MKGALHNSRCGPGVGSPAVCQACSSPSARPDAKRAPRGPCVPQPRAGRQPRYRRGGSHLSCVVPPSSPRDTASQAPSGWEHLPAPAPYLRAFWRRCRQSRASGQCLRDCRKRCTWGRRTLLGGKRPVHSQSSSQPRSSLYLPEDGCGPAGVRRPATGLRTPRGSTSLGPSPWQHRPAQTHLADSQTPLALLRVRRASPRQATPLPAPRK